MDHKDAISRIPHLLSEVLEAPVQVEETHPQRELQIDLELRSDDHYFVVEYKGSARAEPVESALAQLFRYQRERPRAVSLLVVPYMGDLGKRQCQAHGVSWLDLSGNANLRAAGLRVRIEGKPNLFKHPGRPADLFAPRSSRIARALLLHPDQAFSQSELAQVTELHRGDVSFLVRRYEEAGFVRREQEGRKFLVRAIAPDRLLEAWREAYDFSVHDQRRGHVPARSGEELLRQLATTFDEAGVEYAATGLAGAWLFDAFAAFRLVTVYLPEWPDGEALKHWGFREEPRGANVWLVRPKDVGVLHGRGVRDGIYHVSAVQTYLDLKAQPERAEEAAEELRRSHLTWGARHG